MAAVSENNLIASINQQDVNGSNVVPARSFSFSYTGVAGELDIRAAPDTSQHTLDLPTPTIYQFFIKNTHATGVITLVGTVTGGSTQTIAKIPPGGMFAYWAVTAANGYTELKYTADVS